MKRIQMAFIASCLAATSNFSYAQESPAIGGGWSGVLKTPGGNLDLIFKIVQEKNTIHVKMDVPAQHAMAIQASKSVLKGDSLVIGFDMMQAIFKGKYVKDSAYFKGVWQQGAISLPINLSKYLIKEPLLSHPQEPKPPYNYNKEDISFENTKAKIKLAGTFTWPKLKRNVPVVILITGSGPQNRDEELMGHKPFLVLADYLTSNDIAVLRFDDRGVGASGGTFSTATSNDFASDVEAAIQYLMKRKEIDVKKIGLIGHSEGGLIAPMVASQSKDVAFVVMLAGPGVKGSEVIALQATAIGKEAGMTPEELKTAGDLNRKIYAIAMRNSVKAADSIKFLMKETGMDDQSIKAQTQSILSPWYRGFLASDPTLYLSKVDCPFFALNGKKDLQVVYKENLAGIEKALVNNKNHQVKAYDGLNHLFQHCASGAPSEYGTIEETMSQEVMSDIGNWILLLK